MESDEEITDHQDESEDHDTGDEPSDSKISFANFLFGNVDEKGELETDFLDDVCCACLCNSINLLILFSNRKSKDISDHWNEWGWLGICSKN